MNSLTADQIPALVEMVQKEFRDKPNRYDNGGVSDILMSALFERWVMVDPAASIAFVNSCMSRAFQKNAAARCFGALGSSAPAPWRRCCQHSHAIIQRRLAAS